MRPKLNISFQAKEIYKINEFIQTLKQIKKDRRQLEIVYSPKRSIKGLLFYNYCLSSWSLFFNNPPAVFKSSFILSIT